MNILNNNTKNIESIKDDFDKQVLRIFVATSKSSANYWYVETNNGSENSKKRTPEVSTVQNGIKLYHH